MAERIIRIGLLILVVLIAVFTCVSFYNKIRIKRIEPDKPVTATDYLYGTHWREITLFSLIAMFIYVVFLIYVFD